MELIINHTLVVFIHGHFLQSSLVVGWVVLELVKLAKHFLINFIDLSTDVVTCPRLVQQVRNVVPSIRDGLKIRTKYGNFHWDLRYSHTYSKYFLLNMRMLKKNGFFSTLIENQSMDI